jgi:hypothetical protein
LARSHKQAGSFLSDDDSLEETQDIGEMSVAGQSIGPYKLREVIGEGGMGIGWFILAQAGRMIAVDQGDRIGVEKVLPKLEGAMFLMRDSVAVAGWTAIDCHSRSTRPQFSRFIIPPNLSQPVFRANSPQ